MTCTSNSDKCQGGKISLRDAIGQGEAPGVRALPRAPQCCWWVRFSPPSQESQALLPKPAELHAECRVPGMVQWLG